MRLRNLIIVGIFITVAALIYFFSSQTYQEQSLVPLMRQLLPNQPFADVLSNIEVTYWGTAISIETKGYYYFLEFFIRKFAHLFLFGCLAVALFRVLMIIRSKRVWSNIVLSLVGTAIYAAFDEYHQLLTGGRTPLTKDVILDITGAIIALLLYVPIFTWMHRKK